jgi:hypothetical protein
METVKVDIQKLQLLNDRIAQTIEALNQVRMSVQAHGVPHTAAVAPFGFAPNYAYAQPPFAVQPSYSSIPTYPLTPYAAPFVAPQGYLGIQHTSPMMAQPAWAGSAWQTPTWSTPTWTAGAWPTSATAPWQGNGLSHTSWERTWQRPMW